MNRPICFAAFLIMLFATALFAQPRFIPLNVDYAAFHAPNDSAYLEIYVSFPQRSLQYQRRDSLWLAEFQLNLSLTQAETELVSRKEQFINREKTLDDISPHSELRHQFLLKLPPGNYSTTVKVTDLQGGVTGEYELPLTIHRFTSDSLHISDIVLAAKIGKSAKPSIFTKNGIQVVPNPSGIYHITMPVLYYYAEAFGFAYHPDAGGDYTLRSYVSDINGEVVRKFPDITKSKPGKSAILVGGNNVVALPSGTYFLHLELTDNTTGNTAHRQKRFALFKPSAEGLAQMRAMTTRLMQSFYENFSEASLDSEFAKVRYIATDEEKTLFNGLEGIPAKAEFLANFWKERDPDPATAQNEFKIEYFQKVELADRSFRTKFKPGWLTDRGRVLLIYGIPDEIERSPVQSGTRPYEIWSYNKLENGSIFVFADLQGFGDYELLHSTYRKEVYQPDWERRVRILRDNNTQSIIPDEFINR